METPPDPAASLSPAEQYRHAADALVANLRARDAGREAPRAGQPFPEFALPDAAGRIRRIAPPHAGPLVISFIRGRWCPYCMGELAAWKEALPALAALGGRFLCITAQTAGAARAIADTLDGSADVLCDVDHGLAMALGLAFFMGEPTLSTYRRNGLDLSLFYGSSAGFLPIPATFALGADGIVRAAWVEPDFRERAAPAEVLAALS